MIFPPRGHHFYWGTILAGFLFAGVTLAPAQNIPLPVIPAAVFDITQYGAVGDGRTVNTAALQKTIDACAAAGGGTVRVPAGKFIIGPITLASGINLHLDRGAMLLISDDLQNHFFQAKQRYQDCIIATNAHDLEISGEGVIDGQGQAWWTAFRADIKKATPSLPHRPYLIKLAHCTRLRVSGVTLQNSPMFHLVTPDCTDVTLQNLTIKAPADAPNTDGIDPSGWNYLITDCFIDTGDDNIAIKPNGNLTPGNRNYWITNCTFRHGHGMSVGGGSAGGLENLTVSHCTFNGTDSGIRIKTPRGNGGLLQNVIYEDITMTDVGNPIYLNDYYPERTAPKDPATGKAEPVTDRTPINRNIVFRNVTITHCPNAGTIQGLPEMPFADLTFTNVNISAQTGLKIYHAKGVRFIHSQITAASGKVLTTYDAEVTGLE
jgi:polygalacturonase